MSGVTAAAARPAVLSMAKVVMFGMANLPFLRAAPLGVRSLVESTDDNGMSPADPSLWIYLSAAVFLVLLGGVFAGLTIALMGQDDVNLQVIQASGEGRERKHAGSVLRLLKRGKHWVLVTLLLGNVITNETLPIVLDRSLGGGWPAVLGSTVLIVIFGEIIPQSICVRYGLPIGAWMSPLVLALMYVLGPVAWPTAKLLDWLLGEEHGNMYKKAGLKTLVGLHKTLGTSPNERLNHDEVTIISAVLDLKDKSVGGIMTPIDDVFTMPSDTVLDEKTMDIILSAGYSRIPIYAPGNEHNFVGMLLVKVLITYDPEDCKRVGDFALATLPETRPETSCLDIVNFFQEGKSHMVLVSDCPGEDRGALGVVTLEDVIEELIGEEIIDESDVFVDVHKAIRRIAPAPKARVSRGQGNGQTDTTDEGDRSYMTEETQNSGPNSRNSTEGPADGVTRRKPSIHDHTASSRTTLQLRRQSSNVGAGSGGSMAVRGNAPEVLDQLKHLGPSNLASRPRTTRYNTVKIKPGDGLSGDEGMKGHPGGTTDEANLASSAPTRVPGTGLLITSGRDAKDGVQAIQAGYGTITLPKESPRVEGGTESPGRDYSTRVGPDLLQLTKRPGSKGSQSGADQQGTQDSQRSPRPGRAVARSGSITENVIHAGGVRKVVLETTSSSSDPEEGLPAGQQGAPLHEELRRANEDGSGSPSLPGELEGEALTGKKKRRRKRKPRARGGSGETTPLLDRQEEEED